MEQLQCLGILQTCEVLKVGMPTRVTYTELKEVSYPTHILVPVCSSDQALSRTHAVQEYQYFVLLRLAGRSPFPSLPFPAACFRMNERARPKGPRALIVLVPREGLAFVQETLLMYL